MRLPGTRDGVWVERGFFAHERQSLSREESVEGVAAVKRETLHPKYVSFVDGERSDAVGGACLDKAITLAGLKTIT